MAERPMDFSEILTVMNQRRAQDGQLLRSMIDVRDRYNGDIVLPLPDVDGGQAMSPPTPRLLADAIDAIAMRAASTKPQLSVPAVDPDKLTGKRSREFATIRRRACYASWWNSGVGDVLLPRAYRHFAGYGRACMMVVPDFENKRSRVELRDPLTAYPEQRVPEDIHPPRNVGFVYGRSASWISANFPEAEDFLTRSKQWDTIWDLVEWVDDFNVVIGILGPRTPTTASASQPQRQPFGGLELRRYPNRLGYAPVALVQRVTLDRILSLVSTMIPTFDLMGKLTALDVIAAEKAVFGDLVVLGKDGRPPQLVGGAWQDGRTGEANLLVDADVKLLQSSPGPLTHPVIDRLERNIRISTGLIAAMGGEAGGNLRTGQAINTIGDFAVDPRVMEAQDLMARGLAVVNQSLMDLEKGYWPNKTYTVFSGWPADPGHVTYTPSKHFESGENVVRYSFPGLDVSQVSVAVGQMVGAGLISKKSARAKHPLVEDADAEAEAVNEERLEEALLLSILNQSQSGQVTPEDAARIIQRVRHGEDVAEAVVNQHHEAQQRQAQQAPPEAPEAQPGMAQPGAGAEAASIPPPPAGVENLHMLLRALRSSPSQGPAQPVGPTAGQAA